VGTLGKMRGIKVTDSMLDGKCERKQTRGGTGGELSGKKKRNPNRKGERGKVMVLADECDSVERGGKRGSRKS